MQRCLGMARSLRIEFPGATYHVTSRGDRREPIFEDDDDRRILLSILCVSTGSCPRGHVLPIAP